MHVILMSDIMAYKCWHPTQDTFMRTLKTVGILSQDTFMRTLMTQP
jgi:hypothetical protein